MWHNQIYNELNKITQKESFTMCIQKYFAGQADVLFFFKDELQNIDDQVKLIPLGINNKFIGYIAFKKINIINNIWNTINKYYLEFAAVVRRVQSHEDNNRTIKHIRILSTIQSIANSNLKLDEVYNRIAHDLKKVIHFDRASMTIINEDKKTIAVFAVFDESKTSLGTGKILEITNTAQQWICENKKPYIAVDILNNPIFQEDFLLASEDYRSALRVPMLFKNEIIGAINFNSKHVDNFTAYDAEFALKVATVLSYAVVNTKMIREKKEKTEQIAKENRHLKILNNVLNKLSEANEFKSSIKEVLEDIVKEFNLAGSECYLNINKKLILENSYFVNSNSEFNNKKNFSNNIIEKFHKGEISFDENNAKLFLPIKTNGKLLGAIVFNGNVYDLYEKEHDFIHLLIKQISVVVENILLFRTVKFAAEFDTLTGLYNKKKFFALLRREISRCKRNKDKLVLIMADIDDFKAFNDQYGHLTGDRILKNVANIISNNLRKSDIAGRFGGEEFLILLPSSEISLGYNFAKRLAKVINELTGNNNISISIGLAELDIEKDDAVSIVRRADNALYDAKNKGKNTITIASKG